MNTKKAIKLFDLMCQEDALRDSSMQCLADAHSGDAAQSASVSSIFNARAAKHGARYGELFGELFAGGFLACRDASNRGIQTLYHEGAIVARWHGFGEIERL